MNTKNIIVSIALTLTPSAFADSYSAHITADEVVSLENYDYAEHNGYERCVDRKFKSHTQTEQQVVGKGRESKTEYFEVSTEADDLFVVEESVQLWSTNKAGNGHGCIGPRLIKKSGASGATGISYRAHARSVSVGTRGVQDCKLTWRECTAN